MCVCFRCTGVCWSQGGGNTNQAPATPRKMIQLLTPTRILVKLGFQRFLVSEVTFLTCVIPSAHGDASPVPVRSSSTLPTSQPGSAPSTPTGASVRTLSSSSPGGEAEGQEERGDLIHFYNHVYVKQMRSFALKYSNSSLAASVRLPQLIHVQPAHTITCWPLCVCACVCFCRWIPPLSARTPPCGQAHLVGCFCPANTPSTSHLIRQAPPPPHPPPQTRFTITSAAAPPTWVSTNHQQTPSMSRSINYCLTSDLCPSASRRSTAWSGPGSLPPGSGVFLWRRRCQPRGSVRTAILPCCVACRMLPTTEAPPTKLAARRSTFWALVHPQHASCQGWLTSADLMFIITITLFN